MLPERERLLQLARLIGIDAFAARFGPPQSAVPGRAALHTLVDERFDAVAAALVDEAAASDDVTDREGARSFLEDRLATLGDLLSKEQADRLRVAFDDSTEGW